MALGFAHGAIQWLAADVVNTDYVVNGLNFEPKAFRFYTQGLASAVDATSTTTHSRRSVGFATSPSNRACVGSQDQDAAATMVCTTGYTQAGVAMTLTSTPAIDGLLDLNALAFDTFTLRVSDQAPIDMTVFWEAWGGNEITVALVNAIAEPAATGVVDYTVTGFDNADAGDQVVMFAGSRVTAAPPTAVRNDSGVYVGFATSGDSAQNITLVGNSDDGSANADTHGYALAGECIAMITQGGGNPNARAQLTQFNANGFRLNWIARAATGRWSIFLAIKGGSWRAGSYTIDSTTVGATATVSGLPFTPIGGLFMTAVSAVSTPGVSHVGDLFYLGTGSGPTSRRSMDTLSLPGAASADITLGISYDQILQQSYAANQTAYDLDAILAGGFRVIVDVALASAPILTWQGYLTFGNTEVASGQAAGVGTVNGLAGWFALANGASSGLSTPSGFMATVYAGTGESTTAVPIIIND